MKEFIEKLIGRLEEIKDDTGKNCSKVDFGKCNKYKNCGVCLVDRTIDIVNELAEEHKGGWIPCSERLPEAKKEVLIFADDNAMFVGRLMNGGFSVHDGDGWIDLKFILAWQPLPAPYKEPAAGPAMTNADRIRNMTDEELAKFIHAVGCCRNFGGIPCGYPFCHSMEGNLCHGIKDSTDARTLKWLKSEVVKE